MATQQFVTLRLDRGYASQGDLQRNTEYAPFSNGVYRIYMTMDNDNIPMDREVAEWVIESQRILPVFKKRTTTQRQGRRRVRRTLPSLLNFREQRDQIIDISGQRLIIDFFSEFVNEAQWSGRVLFVILPTMPPESAMLEVNNYSDGRSGWTNPDTGRRVRAPRTLRRIFRKYNLLHISVKDGPYTELDNNIPGEYDDNCLVNYLIKQYDVIPKSKKAKISPKMIKKFFSKNIKLDCGIVERYSIERLTQFCNKYKITCRLYDGFGYLMFKQQGDKKRKALNAMVMDHHLYIINTELRTNDKIIKLTPKEDRCENSIRISSRVVKETINEDEKKKIDLARDLYTNTINGHYNISWLFDNELDVVYPRPLIKQIASPGTYAMFDMKKSYPTILKNMTSHDKIPYWSVFDIIQCTTSNCNLNVYDTYVYFITKEALDKLHESFGFIGNYFMGFLTKWLTENNYLSISDIIAYKPASRYVCGDILLRDIKKSIGNAYQWDNWEDDRTLPDSLRFVFGKCCSSRNTPFTKALVDIHKDDTELLLAQQDENNIYTSVVFEEKVEGCEWRTNNIAKVQTGRNKTKNINAYGVDYFIKQKCALIMVQAMHACTKGKPHIIKHVVTDGFYADVNTQLESLGQNSHLFRKEIRTHTSNFKKTLTMHDSLKYVFHINPEDIRQGCLDEIEFITFNKFELLVGPPGTGKTYQAKRMSCTHGITHTNLAVLNMRLKDTELSSDTAVKLKETLKLPTCYKFFSLHDHDILQPYKYNGKKIWIDEISMIERAVWNFIILLAKYSTCTFVLTGDFNQLPPINEEPYSLDMALFQNMKITHMTTDYRNSPELIELRSQIISFDPRSINAVNNVCTYIDIQTEPNIENYECHITYTNKRRCQVNKIIARRLGHTFTIPINTVEDSLIFASEGVILKLNKTYKKFGICKGDRLRVHGNNITKNSTYWSAERLFNPGEIITGISLNVLDKCELGYAMTCHSVQGQTIIGNIVLHEVQKMATKEHGLLYTAITRLKSLDQLYVQCADINTASMGFKAPLKSHVCEFDGWRFS